METKVYLDAQTYLRDSWRLARQILDSGWRPEVMLALWRGGAAVGAAVHEFLKVKGLSLRHMPVKCASYTGIGQSQTEVVFSHAEDIFASLEPGTKVLVIDDVFDTGRTAAAVRRLSPVIITTLSNPAACSQHIEKLTLIFALQRSARVLRQCNLRRAVVVGCERP